MHSECKARVLMADDEPALLRAYARMLRQAGYTVEEAVDGKMAARLAGESDFDVIVSDIDMPGINGVELLRQVRGRNLDVPVVLMTGQPAVETAIRAVEYGALRYLIKPVDEKVLVGSLDRAVRLHQMAKLKRQALVLYGKSAEQPGDRVGLETSLNRALKSLWMAYQPVVSWTGKTLFAFEALLRTTEPTLPDPVSVLTAAQRLGRLEDVGRAVRAQVASAVPNLPAESVFVNLHIQDLLDDSLYDRSSPLTQVAERVVLEITEHAMLDGVKDIRQRISNLRALGFRIAIDDLGAGYAGLTSFAHLEPDVVKLDMSLVQNAHRHSTKRKLIGSMTALCREMDMRVVAEGVETPEERDALIECGCDLLQGYLFARPDKAFPSVAW
ncbi:MAG: EAL domain-containing protein [Nevskiales bacterium]|nr:EAL domain-containing protein [Nevskiales bacterium]